ncbi:ATP-binding protein [Caminibacter mediatlanticus]|uniref:Helicase HerA central domain-containing protein n=1 Tax=Caminibacter mediatlanticus TB-2 TaxID=391592 RepID=A0AAI9AHM4_9BACT|nr:DUF87 domain-containing protein [Caminibacter mediatlanticus]EDM23685.1 hypothetical protein CMTB2_05352 [Caminibacter mediatlanticus TB-2]
MNFKEIYEKAGLFYLGRNVDENQNLTDNLTLYKNKNFTTHAAIIGMTGSGKTGLGIGLIEEAAIDNIPAIVIDPKGDMGNLLLTDPSFSPEKFKEWVENDAIAKNKDPLEYAKEITKIWKEGIYSWHQDEKRVEKLHNVKKVIYTPGSNSGISVNILSALFKPSDEIMNDIDNFVSYINSTVSSLLSLIGVKSNSNSKEFVFLSQLITKAWQNNENLTIENLVSKILNPPFKKIGVLPLDNFIEENERLKLANKFNALIASPAFMNWLYGEELNIDKLFYDENGRAKISIFYLAHLSDEQRMFFVTLLLNKIIEWMRRQSGSNRLRAILYMDEIYGYFPPSKNPPSKEPMMILLKQARAFGLGVILSTQNPVDLDYKGLSNIGTWFIGRLQTKQDIQKVIDGLSGKSDIPKSKIKDIISNLKKRTFFLKSAHIDEPVLFQTRWVLSYLKGPLKKDDISKLMKKNKKNTKTTSIQKNNNYITNIIFDGLQRFEIDPTRENRFYPTIAAKFEVNYSDSRRGIDKKDEYNVFINIEDMNDYVWEEYEELDASLDTFSIKKPNNAKLKPLSEFVLEDKNFKKAKRELKEFVYNNFKLELYKCPKLRIQSNINENYNDFKIKVEDILKEKLEEEIEKLKERYKNKIDRINTQILKAQQQIQKEKADQTSSIIDIGISLISALFGRKSVSKVGRTVSKSTRVLKERGDVQRATERLELLKQKLQDIELELEDKIDKLYERFNLDNYPIIESFIKPKKSSIDIKEISVLWRVDF